MTLRSTGNFSVGLAVFAGVPLHGTLQTGTDRISRLLQQPQDQGKAKGLAACSSQTASPFGCLNNLYFRILSNFLGSLQIVAHELSFLNSEITVKTSTYG